MTFVRSEGGSEVISKGSQHATEQSCASFVPTTSTAIIPMGFEDDDVTAFDRLRVVVVVAVATSLCVCVVFNAQMKFCA